MTKPSSTTLEKDNNTSSSSDPSPNLGPSIEWKPQEDGFRIHAGHSTGCFKSLHVPSSPSPSPETIPGCLGFWEAPMAPNDCEACRLKDPCRATAGSRVSQVQDQDRGKPAGGVS